MYVLEGSYPAAGAHLQKEGVSRPPGRDTEHFRVFCARRGAYSYRQLTPLPLLLREGFLEIRSLRFSLRRHQNVWDSATLSTRTWSPLDMD